MSTFALVFAVVLFSAGSMVTPLARSARALGEEVVPVVLDSKNFTQVDWARDATEAKLPCEWRGCTIEDVMGRLSKVKPDAVTAIPRFQGSEQWYGAMKLGPEGNIFYFVMDVVTPQKMFMYFDFNRNGRLDDEKPIPHGGKFNNPTDAGFAAKLAVPWDKLMANPPFPGTVKLWFILNNVQWTNKGFSHRDDTFFQGKLTLDGKPYTIYLHDSAALNDNDADFTNDGLYIKLGEGNLMYVSPEQAKNGVVFGSKVYKFPISYGASVNTP